GPIGPRLVEAKKALPVVAVVAQSQGMPEARARCLMRRLLNDLDIALADDAVETFVARLQQEPVAAVIESLVRSTPAHESFIRYCYTVVLGRQIEASTTEQNAFSVHVEGLDRGFGRVTKLAELLGSDEFFWMRCGENASIFAAVLKNILLLD